MNRVPLLLSSIALVTIAGCATESITSASVAPAPVSAPTASPAAGALRAGFGRVEQITLVAPTTVATGRATSRTNKNVAMRMEDGTIQYFDTQAHVAVGDRVEITSNGTLRRWA